MPCSDEAQVTVSINIHEMRVLVQWAENYARSIAKPEKEFGDPPEVIAAIAARLRKQLPEESCLTMGDEIRALRDKFPNILTNHPAADAPDLGEVYDPGLGPESNSS